MKRLLGVAVAALLASVLLAAVPASAHLEDVCVGQGTAVTGALVYYPIFGPPVLAGTSANFTLAVGGCLAVAVTGHSGNVNGQFSPDLVGNYCGHSSGTTNSAGHLGQWTSAGSMLVISPIGGIGTSMSGNATVVPDAVNGESCFSGADSFLVTGEINLF